MKDLLKKNWFLFLLGLFLVTNIFLVIYNFIIAKQRRMEYQQFLNEIKQSKTISNVNPSESNSNINFYDMPCPEISKYSTTGQKINLRNYVGNVVLLRFSRFYKEDLPNLLYLQLIAEKYEDLGISLIFINALGAHDEEEISKNIHLSYPIIEDDGSIIARFNAFPEDLIIVDRNFYIKFKFDRGSKTIIYDEIIKWIFKDQAQQNPEFERENSVIKSIQKLKYYDVFDNETRKIIDQKNKKICLTIFSSICNQCEGNERIRHLKELSNKLENKSFEIFVLFGKGNPIEVIRQYAILNGLDKLKISIGIVEESNALTRKEYYQIFQLDVDPRTFIINSEQQISFFETRKTTKIINPDFLREKLK